MKKVTNDILLSIIIPNLFIINSLNFSWSKIVFDIFNKIHKIKENTLGKLKFHAVNVAKKLDKAKTSVHNIHQLY